MGEEDKYNDKVQPNGGNEYEEGELIDDNHGLKRHLSNRKIMLIAIGGSIGTALFVSIGGALNSGGPGSLLLAYGMYSCVLALVNNAMAEMCVYMPVNASFIRHAAAWVDDAWGYMAGWNFFLYEAILIPFEISALNLVLKFWSNDIPAGAICAACIVTYGYCALCRFALTSDFFCPSLPKRTFPFPPNASHTNAHAPMRIVSSTLLPSDITARLSSGCRGASCY